MFGMLQDENNNYYLPQFSISVDQFITGVLNKKLAWYPQNNAKLQAKVILYKEKCWCWGKNTNSVRGIGGDYGIGANAPYFTDNDVKDNSKGTNFFSQGAAVGSNYFGGYGSGLSIKYDNSISFKLFIMGDGAVIAECLNAGNQRRNVLWEQEIQP